jgi:hypothetical protein
MRIHKANHVQLVTCVLTLLTAQIASALVVSPGLTRRALLDLGVRTTSLVFPTLALAEDAQEEASNVGLFSTVEVAKLLTQVPTFAIVDTAGVPFFVVGEDAKVTSYFFTTYKEASRILALAKTSANKAISEAKKEGKSQEEIGTNPWNSARISTVPLDFAVTLATRSNAIRGGGTYFQVASAEEDIEDALELTGQDNLQEGKVPLFYDKDFTIEINGALRTPLYFHQADLKGDYKKLGDKSRKLNTSTTELFAVVTELVKPGGSDMDLKALAFITPKGSEQKKIECERKGGKDPPFIFGQRIIVL